MTIKHANTLFLLLILFLSYSIFLYPQIISDWRTYSFDDGTYSHAYLMPFVIATLLWQQRNNLKIKFNVVYLIAAITLALVLAISITAQQISLTRLIFPLYVILLFCSLLKPSTAFIVPLALLWFISPFWGSLVAPLQYIAVLITTFCMQLTHIPIFVDGNFIQIPQGVFEIAEGCSGLRYFIVSLALSTLLCHLHLRKLRNMLLVTLFAIVGAIVVNGIRIVLIILIGYYTDMQSSIVKDHNMFGWFLYIPFIIILFYIVGKLEPLPETKEQAYVPLKLPGRGVFVVIVSSLIVSGISLKLVMQQYPLFDYSVAEITEVDTNTTPAAAIASYSEKQRENIQINGIDVIIEHYKFAGRHDADRADYYLNKLIPNSWHKTNNQLTANSQLLWLSDGSGNTALLQYWYEANGQPTGSIKEYKRNRIKQALKLDATSALHWQFVYCKSVQCRDEVAILKRYSNNVKN
ncbi:MULTISPECIES: exosortase [Rheinheimera]|uniref:exosortase n=1 Tax=Rheinheimera TaxID=67575 RepID=UPI00104C4B34|nr:exosortase [Rheinheimera sp. D18]QBL09611.1 exosortase [Rheinheimera sp. D18]